MPATLDQLIRVFSNVFSRVKHSSMIPGDPYSIHGQVAYRRQTASGCYNASKKPLQVLKSVMI